MSYFLSMVEVDGTITDVCFTVDGNIVIVETEWTDSATMERIGNAPVREMTVADARVYYKQHLAKGFCKDLSDELKADIVAINDGVVTKFGDDYQGDIAGYQDSSDIAEYNAIMNAESADLDAMDRYAEQECIDEALTSYCDKMQDPVDFIPAFLVQETIAVTTDGTALRDTTEFYFNGACTMEVVETPNNVDLIVLCDELITNFVRHTDGGCIVTVDEENLWLVEDYLSNNILSVYKNS